LLTSGCQPTKRRADIQQIPQITELVEKATAPPPVHRFRKPLREERARILHQLSAECDRMIADIRGLGVNTEALTGSVSEGQRAMTADPDSLEASLARLAQAAREGNNDAIRAAHTTALAAYARVRQPSTTAAP
jgi:hypothetical protein